jgi:two-component system response regulator MprA
VIEIERATRPLLLIVDDDTRTANLLGRLLRNDGYDSEVTADGASALARLTRCRVPDALITDFHLAHADGLAVGRYARSRRAAMPIFVVTGDPGAVLRAPDPLRESFVVFTKPVDYAELVRQLRAALAPIALASTP